MTKEQPNNKQLAGLMMALLIPVSATARLLSFWVPKPSAQAISVFVWMFAVYWIPPKPKMKPWVWLIIVVLVSGGVLLLHAFGVAPF